MATEIRATSAFKAWIDALRDTHARARIQARIQRLALGHAGQHRHLGQGVCELKIDVGPGYRVCCMKRGALLVVLLCGGDKASRRADIAQAFSLADDIEN